MTPTLGLVAQGAFDNDSLDKWEIPFGLWIEEIVFWLTTHIGDVLDWIKWPVDQALNLIIDDILQDWLPWPVVLFLFFLLGVATRNYLVGLGTAAALLVSGLLGNDYWNLTMETLGMIIVAVIICAVIGIPLGILAARVDSFWNRLRPILDGMQVIHPFVYLLPIIFLFGVRRTPGVLATLVFALPPIVRLTNLGVRQVPEDVVEAARAFGATERRVLTEVQLPLARPAIMAGLNQTLLLSLSMVGIVAIIAGGGLGKPILTALNTADIPTGASAGAALYFVGVLLDRISQTDPQSKGNLFSRMRRAWALRDDPVVPPLPVVGEGDELAPVGLDVTPPPELTPPYRVAALAAIGGGLLAAFSTLLTWGSDAGKISAFIRFEDADLPGAHSGLSATGGSWFGIVFGLLGLAVALAGAFALWRPRSRSSFGASVGAFFTAGFTLLALVVAYLTISTEGENYSNGVGIWVALLAALIVLVAAAYAALRSESDYETVRVGKQQAIIVVVLAAFIGLAGAGGSWILDTRSNAAEIARELAAQAEGPEQGGVAAELLAEALAGTRRVATLGFDTDGPQIGYIIVALTVLGTIAGIARIVPKGRRQLLLGLVMFGVGVAIAAIAFAWMGSLIRLGARQVTPGASAFLAACGGLVLAALGWRAANPD